MEKMARGLNYFFILVFISLACYSCNPKINRFALVTRHNILQTHTDSLSCLTVGNGNFAYTVDITGLQTFPENYKQGIPLGTFSNWAWHSFPNPEKYSLNDVTRYYKVGNDSVPYFYQFDDKQDTAKANATTWLRENPHRIHMGLIDFELLKPDSSTFTLNDIQNPKQELNLWNGEIKSHFDLEGTPVDVLTLCDQEYDRIIVRVNSELIKTGQLKIKIKFPYASHKKFNSGLDFNHPNSHTSEIIKNEPNSCLIKRVLDSTTYYSCVNWEGKAKVIQKGAHEFILAPETQSSSLDFSVWFTDTLKTEPLPDFTNSINTNRKTWHQFWENGGAVDFSECTDPRAFELERRVVLSQYLTKIQCSGTYPPQETGLAYNSWYGKFHLEMHWWHGIHFLLWNRPEIIEKQLAYYFKIENAAKQQAKLQGYKGVRWPKMTDPEGRESPSNIGVFLIWQQPHFIYFANLLYNVKNQDKKVLEKHSPLVFATADFMADYARFDSVTGKYILGPALIPAQERFSLDSTINPAFELAYWYWGLETAQQWREKLGMERNKKWQQVIDNLAPLPVKDSLYLFTESATDTWSNPKYMTDHPMILGLLGFLPKTKMVDRQILLNTQKETLKKWNWQTCWGWDFPLMAMNAVQLGNPSQAIDLLMMKTQKNTWLMNGHNYQNTNLPLYLPGNGGLLTAVAMLCTYRNTDGKNGFPDNGQWKVKYENIHKLY